ncbi:glutathione transferase GstA [Pseudomonas sp. WS 5011]|uniref:glutathione transferase GstA n=2 Tax=unclassified Pseudomonas TaxID=196821 RepID=UPI0014730259|nr:glutathione transferase GstA [Pseudomonas sp. WS 5011]NMY50109.1 glutathione transferase GstA [Pseudomonas sp. WS 5011]|tara:strand:+ start:11378 stop:11986 length:609 start_codon:yes stop_codon:yes gene_type:complete
MKLYYTPGACSLAAHIVLCELGLPHELVRVDLNTHTTAGGGDFYAINPKGYVPALELEYDQVLTEDAVLLQYLAELKGDVSLLPPAGSMERWRVLEWLNFISSELHKGLGALFNPAITPEWKQAVLERVSQRLDLVNQALKGNAFLCGRHFTIADAYLFTIVNWTGFMHIDLAPWPELAAYQLRMAERPAVQQAMRAEGLLK